MTDTELLLLPCFCHVGFPEPKNEVHQNWCPAYYRQAVADDKKKAVEAMQESCIDLIPLNWTYGDLREQMTKLIAAIRRIEVE